MPLGDNARLGQIDLSIHHSTVANRKLVKNDGSIDATHPVVSVRVQSLSPGDEAGSGSDVAVMAVTTDAPVPQEVIDDIVASDGFIAGRAVPLLGA